MNLFFYFYFAIARDVVAVSLLFVDLYQSSHTISQAHLEAQTHKHTCMISTQEELREPGTEACLEGAEEGVCLKQRNQTKKQ